MQGKRLFARSVHNPKRLVTNRQERLSRSAIFSSARVRVSPRTRAQTRHNNSESCLDTPSARKRGKVRVPVASASTPVISSSELVTPSSSKVIVASPSPRPSGSGLKGQGNSKRASGCPWELRALRGQSDKLKMDTPELSNNSISLQETSKSQTSASRSDDGVGRPADKDEAEDFEGGAALSSDSDNADSDESDDENVENNDSLDDEDEDPVGLESENEQDVEEREFGCSCTSDWSCGGHSCLKIGPSTSTPKYNMVREDFFVLFILIFALHSM